jgi:hypothetical protein
MTSFQLTTNDLCLLLMIATKKCDANYDDDPGHNRLAKLGLIELHAGIDDGEWLLTERAYMHIESLLSVPEPVQRWGKP